MSSSTLTAEQAKAKNVLAMGEELGPIYDALWQQVAWLHRKWSEYVILFGTKESRVVLLNEAARPLPESFKTRSWKTSCFMWHVLPIRRSLPARATCLFRRSHVLSIIRRPSYWLKLEVPKRCLPPNSVEIGAIAISHTAIFVSLCSKVPNRWNWRLG